MKQLHKAIGDLPLLAVCLDACKGLTGAVAEIFLNAKKRECFQHLMQNYVKYFSSLEHIYPAARAYMASIFEHHFDNVKNMTRVKHWLDEWHPLLWYRCGFHRAIKCDYITNNILVVFNNWIQDYKDLVFLAC
jgi:transposase-like protein